MPNPGHQALNAEPALQTSQPDSWKPYYVTLNPKPYGNPKPESLNPYTQNIRPQTIAQRRTKMLKAWSESSAPSPELAGRRAFGFSGSSGLYGTRGYFSPENPILDDYVVSWRLLEDSQGFFGV